MGRAQSLDIYDIIGIRNEYLGEVLVPRPTGTVQDMAVDPQMVFADIPFIPGYIYSYPNQRDKLIEAHRISNHHSLALQHKTSITPATRCCHERHGKAGLFFLLLWQCNRWRGACCSRTSCRTQGLSRADSSMQPDQNIHFMRSNLMKLLATVRPNDCQRKHCGFGIGII